MMEQRKLGSTGPTVSALGLGCMAMSDAYGPADRGESIATIHAALGAGITLLDTGDFYNMGHNEMLIREALKDLPRDKLEISVKFGALRGPAGEFVGMDCRPVAMKNFLAYSLQRLGTDYIDIYRPARLDPNVPIEETIGGIAGTGRDHLGRRSGQRHRAAGRRPQPQPSRRSAWRDQGDADADASCSAGKGLPARHRVRHALRSRADGASRQRETGQGILTS